MSRDMIRLLYDNIVQAQRTETSLWKWWWKQIASWFNKSNWFYFECAL